MFRASRVLIVSAALAFLASAASSQTLSGRIFYDPDASGSRAATEVGASGIVVSAYDVAGGLVSQTASCGLQAINIPAAPPTIPSPIAVAACSLSQVGDYTLSGIASGTDVRLELTWSDGLLFDGAQGSGAGTSVQFASGGDSGVEFGVSYPEDYCQDNPRLIAGCYVFDTTTFTIPPWTPGDTSQMIVSWPYDQRVTTATGSAQIDPHDDDAVYGSLGHILGVTIHRSTRKALFSAIASPLWPAGGAGIGGLYTADYTGAMDAFAPGSVALLADLNGVDADPLDDLVDLTAQNPVTVGVLDRFGEQGIGGIDLSADDQILWAINMGAGSLLRIDIGDPPTAPGAADITEIPIPDPGCTGGVFRPGAVTTRRGSVFIGGVCDASATAGAGTANLSGEVIEYDGSTFTPRFSFPLDFLIGKIFQASPASFPLVKWQATDDQFEPQPFLTNLVFDDDDSLVLGFMPRISYHALVQVAGFMVRAQSDGSGGYSLESGGVSGPLASTARTAWDGVNTFGQPGNPVPGEGPGGTWFYENGLFHGFSSMFHSVLFSAGLTIVPGSGEVAAGFTDPLGIDAFGVRYLDRINGRGVAGTQFGGLKVALVSDVDILCRQSPLEIGNRLWCDGGSGTSGADNNGIQDPGEAGVDGIIVTLRCGTDSPVTTVTSGGGNYLFTDALYLASSNASEIPRGASCTVSIDRTASSAALIAACGTDRITTPNSGGLGDGADLRDSDAVDLGGGVAGTTFTSGEPGENDHTVDLGIEFLPPVTSDFGDAPDTYGTVAGASHEVPMGASLYLGACVDSEASGQAAAAFGDPADGDDANDAGKPLAVAGTCAGGDDEDGVTFTSMITACGTATISVASQGSGGRLDAWLDFNQDGDFGDAGEQIFTNQALAGGGATDNLQFNVPCSVGPGGSYARFRLSSSGGLGATGATTDGEVEDYEVVLKGLDLADAPNSYATLLGSGGASHVIDPGVPLYLGACVDGEADGQPAAAFGDPADGDDANDLGTPTGALGTCAGGDDEDGVSFDSMIVACGLADVTVVAQGPGGQLNAWLDFNGDGDFADAGEQIFTDQPLPGGGTGTALQFGVPCSVASGTTYARFRVDSGGGLGSAGMAMNGEVEDYQVITKGFDYGDAPNTYATVSGSNGARHSVDPSSPIYLGACVDTESDGQAVSTGDPADGDDLNNLGAPTGVLGTCAGNDDEDGVTFDTMVVACDPAAAVTVTSSGAGALLDAWLDFNSDGDFGDAGEQIFTSQALTGSDTLTYGVPCSAETGTTYARFRVSSAGGLASDGPAMDGEVEDYLVVSKGLDLADAPDSYGTLVASDGARHGVDPNSFVFLGACVDTEVDGQPAAAFGDPADGDDANDLGAPLSTLGTCTGDDDEDGVTFDTMVVACDSSAQVTVVSVGSGALLDGWVDFSGDGDFADPGEQIFASQALTGNDTLTFSVPCDAVAGETYARFRVSTAGGLASDGLAMDGEVEDYLVVSKGLDLADAPDSYGTTLGGGGASHVVDATDPFHLGVCVDTELDGQPSAAAVDDDANAGISTVGTCAGNDDEDGVTFADGMAMVAACASSSVTVSYVLPASGSGFLDGWIDYNGDGDFDDPMEHLNGGNPVALSGSPQVLAFIVPCSALPQATSYARFRVSSSAAGIGPTGPAMDGEVEDYALEIKGVDFGDAPDSYGTTLGTGGPRHTILPGYLLGAAEDSEADGQPTSGADGDDNSGTPDDEDGVAFDGGMAMAFACSTGNGLSVTVRNPSSTLGAFLDAWIDFDGSGTFDAPEHLFGGTSAALTPGVNALTYDVPCDAMPGGTYARFRMSSTGGLDPTTPLGADPAPDGEVEDYPFLIKGLDYGDAPDPTYPTLLASDGARHIVLTTGNPTLGALVDTELDGQPDVNHMGDDQNGVDDEDGVTFPSGALIPGTTAEIALTGGATGGLVDAWIDFNADGDWSDPGEQVATGLAVGAGASVTLAVPVPVGAVQGDSCARFRISSAGGLLPTGIAADGEVEDYPLAIGVEDPVIGVGKELIDLVDQGDGTYELTFEMLLVNLGNVRLTGAQAEASLATAFAQAGSYSVVSVSSPSLTPNLGFDGDGDPFVLAGTDALEVGESGTITMVVLLDPAGYPGPYYCSTVGTGTSPGGTVVDDISQDGGNPDPDGNGDPGDNEEPTVIRVPVQPAEIPTLSTLSLALLASLLLLTACGLLRRRRWAK